MRGAMGALGPRIVRKVGSLLDDAKRRATATTRVLPDFVIMGAQKAGTTSLYNYLSQSEAVEPLKFKEVHYFDNHHDKGLDWYRSRFCTTEQLAERSAVIGGRARTGEATPFYMFHPRCPQRMSAAIPDAQLIVVLREPAERAYSHYQHELRKGVEHLSFDDAIAAEKGRLEQELAEHGEAAFDDPGSLQRHASYCARGHYAGQVARILEHYPRDRLLVLLSDDLFADPRRTYERACEFLGLPPGQLKSVKAQNQGGYEPPVSAGIEGLKERFAKSNADLADLGIDVPW